MICPNCGAQNRDDAKFCKSCGTPFRPLAPGAKDSLATVAGGPSTETTPPMVIGLEAVFLSGLRKGERVKITTFPATIGRDPNSVLPLALQDQLASTRHAQILHEGDGYLLRDVGSSNGTYHNGQRITEVWLKHADVIEFGVGGPQVRFDFIQQPQTAAPDRFEAATLPPIPAMPAGAAEPTFSRKPTLGHDAPLPPPAPAAAADIGAVVRSDAAPAPAAPMTPPPPPPPIPVAAPSPFDSGATAVQGAASARPFEAPPPTAYEAPPSFAPPAPPEATGGRSKLVLFIVLGVVALIVLLAAVAVVAYLIFSPK